MRTLLSRLQFAPTLQEFCAPERGKDNNFNLLRLLAAFAVLFGHCYALLGLAEPLGTTLGMSIGSIAVDIFFISSGFLVGASLIQRQSVVDYILARFLRIFPALWVMLLFVVLLLGAVFSHLPLASYYQDPQLVHHLGKSASLMTGLDFYLPGVFADNPYPRVVNGSLWTMIYELSMYGLLLLVWISYRYSVKVLSSPVALLFALMTGYLAYRTLAYHYILDAKQLLHLGFMFFSGTGYFLARRFIRLQAGIACLIVVLLIMSARFYFDTFSLIYCLTLPYLVLAIAYLPAGLIRRFNRCGDYSYGVYIYAFPIQQAVIAMMLEIEVIPLLLISGVITIACAIGSWHFVEKPVMAQRWKLLSLIKTGRLR